MTRKAPLFRHILAATGRVNAVDPPAVTAARLSRTENARLYLVQAVTSAGISKDICWPPRIDFSRPCVSTLCLASLLCANFNIGLHLFHMLPIPPYPKDTPQSFNADRQRIEKQLIALCRQLLRHARQIRADLIVIGSHTKETAVKWYPGSVAQRLGFQSNCPVLVVSGPEALAHWKDDHCTARLATIDIPRLTLYPV